MSKFWFVIIALIIIFGISFYFEPEQTKDITSGSIDKVNSIIKNLYENREINLGYPKTPCTDNNHCNNFIEECEGKCVCKNEDCIKNAEE